MNWNKGIRQFHRWVSIAFTVTVIANFVAMALTQGQMPPPWVTYLPLLPLALLLFTGLYLFVLPHAPKWRSGRRASKSDLKEIPTAAQPSRPIDAYQAIIDQLVNETRTGGAGCQVVNSGVFSKAPAHRRFDDVIATHSADQRKLLADMLQEERDGAIHDVLALLSWWVDCRGLRFTYRDQTMPVDLSGMGLHGDYIGRRDGWNWPKEAARPGRNPTPE